MKQAVSAKQGFLATNQRDGEVYAGLVLGKNGAPDYHLFKMPGEVENVTWQGAVDWAKSVGGEAPNRRELALLRVNAREHFEDAAYWSCEQHADSFNYVWYQYFYSGGQFSSYKYLKLRGVAVRRLVIE